MSLIAPPPRDDSSAEFQANLARRIASGPEAMRLEEDALRVLHPDWTPQQITARAQKIVMLRNQQAGLLSRISRFFGL